MNAQAPTNSNYAASGREVDRVVVDTGLYPFSANIMSNAGFEYHYVDEGRGTPVVMVHGNPTWSFYYRGLIRELSPDFRCLAPDHIGCGKSEKPGLDRYPYTLQRRVDDFGRFIDGQKLDKIDLIVHDWGGMIGLSWAVDHPDRVRKIVISNTAGFRCPATARVPAALRLARVPGLGEWLVRGLNAFCIGARHMCVNRGSMPSVVAQGYLAPYDSWNHRLAVHRFVADIPLREGEPSYARVLETERKLEKLAKHPILLCWGLRDFVFDSNYLAEFQRYFPTAKTLEFGDCGHYLLEDAGSEVALNIREFLTGESRASSGESGP